MPSKADALEAVQEIGPDGSVYVLTAGQNNVVGYSTADIKEFALSLPGPNTDSNADHKPTNR